MAEINNTTSYKEVLQNYVRDGKLTQEEADRRYYTALFDGDWETAIADPKPDPATLLQNVVASGPTLQDVIGADVKSAADETLQSVINEPTDFFSEEYQAQVADEIATRERLANNSFIDTLTDPEGLQRIGARAVSSVPQSVNALSNTLPGLMQLGVAELTGSDTFRDMAKDAFDRSTVNNQTINRVLGISDPVNIYESAAETAVSAFVPGGFFTKAAAVGSDFVLDQSVRQLTEEKDSHYQTLFERAGLLDANLARPEINPFLAVPLGILAGTTATSVTTKLITKSLPNPNKVLLSDMDFTNPKGLYSVETAGDQLFAQGVDRQEALVRVLEKQGFPNIDTLRTDLAVNTYGALRSRLMEGISAGFFVDHGSRFAPSTSPSTLYRAYNMLEPAVKEQVASYINQLDQLDDARIALNNATTLAAQTPTTTNAAEIAAAQSSIEDLNQLIGRLTRSTGQLATANPLVVKFSKEYSGITGAVRDFLEGSLFSTDARRSLDQDRPNYVPLEFSDVNPNDPFFKRMTDAAKENTARQRNTPWFLQQRDSIGNYPVDRRQDPFDMMLEYTEAAMTSKVQNDLRLRIIDGLLNPSDNQPTIRLAIEDEADRFPDRVVSVFRDGVKENYISSQLQADLLKFDPRVALHPIPFAVKRTWEVTKVGPLSATFAVTTAFRDAVTGAVIRPDGVSVAGPGGILAAVPKQLYAKGARAWAERINAKLVADRTGLLDVFTTPQQQQAFADRLSQAYLDSTYKYIQGLGGFDASLARSNYRIGAGQLAELKRSIRDSPLMNSPIVNNVMTRFTLRQMEAVVDGFTSLYAAVQDAPRFAAIDKTLRTNTTLPPAEAARLGAAMASDVRLQGQTNLADGRPIGADVINPGPLSAMNPALRTGLSFGHEFIPFFNPAIQGARAVASSFINNPIQSNLRAWAYVGLPTMMAYAWNTVLGDEYVQYQLDERSTYDTMLSFYLGVPGQSPDRGISIPIGHENVFHAVPFLYGLDALAKTNPPEETKAAFEIMMWEMAKNSSPLGYPVVMGLADNYQGYQPPDTLMSSEGKYESRDDKTGFLPHNLELVARSMFGLVGDMSTEFLTAMSFDGREETPFEIAREIGWNNLMKRAPIVGGVAGYKTKNTWFSLPSKVLAKRRSAYEEFYPYWNEFFNPARRSEDFDAGRLPKARPERKEGFGGINFVGGEKEGDMPLIIPGMSRLNTPTNPLYEPFGRFLVDNLQRSDAGWTANQDRYVVYGNYVRELRNFNAGQKGALKKWQEALQHVVSDDRDVVKMKELIASFGPGFDLGNYQDRVRMINLLENERAELLQMQLDVISDTEAKLTTVLREKGLLGEQDRFNIEDHLKPFDENPLGSSPDSYRFLGMGNLDAKALN